MAGLPAERARRRRRADAEHNRTAIIRAAISVLNGNPAASIEDVARAAGVTRQTVYAHFASREALLEAVFEHAASDAMAAFDAAGLDDEPPAKALLDLLEVGWKVSAQYPFLWHLPPVSASEDADRHGPVLDWLQNIIRRGQETGDFEPDVSPAWLVTASLALARAAEEEVKAGRMTIDEATSTVHSSLLRLFGLGGH
ncbi:MAG TPA: TetR/AcrR family transcriptional regulator [Streptosporangiaceae bacterium]|nr:TetR/AcrR family transcriptional regulator [Streptosporangiaceae bacterium]